MPYQLEVNDDDRIVHIALKGRVDASLIHDAIDAMEARGVRPYHQVWDFSKVKPLLMEPNDFQDLSERTQERRDRHGNDVGAIVAVADSEDAHLVTRILTHRIGRKGTPSKVFHAVEDAEAWLLEAEE